MQAQHFWVISLSARVCYNEVSVENEIILSIFAEKVPYNMTMWFVVSLIVTDSQCIIIFT